MPAKGAGPWTCVVGRRGIIGLSIAWRLAREGRPVTVVDPAPASGASHAAAGMLAPVSEVTYTEEPLLRLGLASLSRWPAFAAELAADAALPPHDPASAPSPLPNGATGAGDGVRQRAAPARPEESTRPEASSAGGFPPLPGLGWICGPMACSTWRSGPTIWPRWASWPPSWRSWACRSSG